MSSSLAARGSAVFQYPGSTSLTAQDWSQSRGLLLAADANGNLTVNASTTVPAAAIVLDGQVASKPSSIGLIEGLPFMVFVKLSGTVAPFSRIQQAADGGVIADAGAGNARVVIGRLGDQGGVAGDLVPAVLEGGNILA